MSYNEMQKYVNELFEENKQLKEQIKTLENKIPKSYIKEYAMSMMEYDNEFLYTILDHAIAISKDAIKDTKYYEEKE